MKTNFERGTLVVPGLRYVGSGCYEPDEISGRLMVVTKGYGDGNYRLAYGRDPETPWSFIVHEIRFSGPGGIAPFTDS